MNDRSTSIHPSSLDANVAECGFASLPTGNWFVSVPRVRVADAAVDDIGFLHWHYRALVQLAGSQERPFLRPIIAVDGEPIPWDRLSWTHEVCWLPAFQANWNDVHVEGRLFAPVPAERGFVCVLEAWCEGPKGAGREVTLGWEGSWERALHASHLAKPMVGSRYAGLNREHPDTVFLEFRTAVPVFAAALCPSEEVRTEVAKGIPGSAAEMAGHPSPDEETEVTTDGPDALWYRMRHSSRLHPGEGESLALYVGLGLKEVAAVAAARDLRRRGWRDLLAATRSWLGEHAVPCSDRKLGIPLNRNMFYNCFFSQGICLDSEDLVLVSARNPESRWVATYRDRDAMLRSLPGVLHMDPPQARRMLEYGFTLQLRNVGLHSRFVDGAVLEPGFQLDHLCAPILALALYVTTTQDRSMLFDRRVQSAVNVLLDALAGRKHPEVALYSTVLSPDDETSPLPYVTCCNAMLWRALSDLAAIYNYIRDLDRADEMSRLADAVRRAVHEHCVVETPAGPAYASAVDLRGDFTFEDWPNASLRDLPLLQFCSKDDPVYTHTLAWIAAAQEKACRVPDTTEPEQAAVAGCRLVALINDLRLGSQEALETLRNAPLDDGIACELVDADGRMLGGPGNAALAGLLAYALRATVATSGG